MKIKKENLKSLAFYIFVWIAVSFVLDYFFFRKGVWEYDFFETILEPGLIGAIVWVIADWKPWKKE